MKACVDLCVLTAAVTIGLNDIRHVCIDTHNDEIDTQIATSERTGLAEIHCYRALFCGTFSFLGLTGIRRAGHLRHNFGGVSS